MMRAGKNYGTRIVRTISSSSTIVGHGDIHIDANGNAWKQISDAEAEYLRSNGSTVPSHIGKISNGRVF